MDRNRNKQQHITETIKQIEFILSIEEETKMMAGPQRREPQIISFSLTLCVYQLAEAVGVGGEGGIVAQYDIEHRGRSCD